MISFGALKKNLKKEMSALPKVKVALLGDSATQFLAMALRGMGYERGICLELWEAEYNQIERQVLDPTSEFYQFNADIVILFQSTHKLLLRYNQLSEEQRYILAEERVKFVRTLCRHVTSEVIYYNYPDINDAVFGNYAGKVKSSFPCQLRKLNHLLDELSQENKKLNLCDLASIQSKFGRDFIFSPSVYTSTEMVLSIDVLPWVASNTLDMICALRGKLIKCLILDLDNTLWGGVIGDDGLENLQLGHELGIGKIYVEFQQWIKKLKQRGIILAVCSKNTESVAREPFEKHPEMVLRMEDIAVFVANWENKADNIRQIQRVLNIGFDSMVFLDDNPFERNLVRENIPGIVVPELPVDPAEYLEYLYGLNLFETRSCSEADHDRTRQYQEEAQRVMIRRDFTDEVEFLKSLDMVAEVTDLIKFNIPRVAQLSQRSNQFNLRTIRYTETDIEQIKNDPAYRGFCFRLEDKFGDNGLIATVILKKLNLETLFVDTWFMSCRVLKRGMENFTLNTIVAYARENGFKRIVGEYLPTAKNKMVEEHYLQMGFRKLKESDRQQFELNVDSYQNRISYIRPDKID